MVMAFVHRSSSATAAKPAAASSKPSAGQPRALAKPDSLRHRRNVASAAAAAAPVMVDSPRTAAEVAQQERSGQQLGKLLPDGSVLFSAELLRSVVVVLPTGLAATTSAPAAPPAPAATAAPAAPAAAPAAPKAQPVQEAAPVVAGLEELAKRRRWRVMREIVEAAERSQQRGQVRKGFRPTYTKAPPGTKPKYDEDQIMAGLAQLETLVPGFQPNLEALPPEKWAELALDINSVGQRLVALKAEWPTVDLTAMLLKYPKALLMTPQEIKSNAVQVRELLKTAKNADGIIQAVPQMLTPQVAASVLVTINKWWQFKRDPVEILESDPSLVLRAQEMDQPFEPVYQGADGSWVVPGANKAKRPEWAQAIADRAANQRSLRKQPQQQQQQQQQAAPQAAAPAADASAGASASPEVAPAAAAAAPQTTA